MTTTEVRDEADGPVTDVLTVAPRPPDRRVVLTVVAGALVLVLVLALVGSGVWQRLQPPPDLTLAQIEGAYTGMVRSDGTNEVSVVDATRFPDRALTVTPGSCTPLFATTVSNQWPAGALDGASTYWLNEGGASISLFTVRYVDPAAATAAYAEVRTSLDSCNGQQVDFSGPEGPGRLASVAVLAGDADEALAYQLVRDGSQGRYAMHIALVSNTVTWQYRYQAPAQMPADDRPVRPDEPYDPTAGEQLTLGIVTQLRAVQAAAAG